MRVTTDIHCMWHTTLTVLLLVLMDFNFKIVMGVVFTCHNQNTCPVWTYTSHLLNHINSLFKTSSFKEFQDGEIDNHRYAVNTNDDTPYFSSMGHHPNPSMTTA